jgi:hypothetical protein
MEPLIDRSSTHIKILLGVRAKLSEKRKGGGIESTESSRKVFLLA